jgi:hypothetical protein
MKQESEMAKKATAKSGVKPKTKRVVKAKRAAKSTAVAERRSSDRRSGDRRTSETGRRSSDIAGEAFIKLLQSPLAAELVAVAATAALAALAEHGFTNSDGGRGKRAGKAVKEAGKAAASAVGRRLGTEIDEIRKASKH